MDLVIDAHIVGWFYQSCELGNQHPCTGEPEKLFARLGNEDLAFLDSGQMIEAEWRRVADDDWFDAWLFERLSLGDIIVIDVDTCRSLIADLETNCGFPRGSRDRWYVRTARTRAESTGNDVALVSEDVDMFEPKAKNNSGRRKKHLDACSGCVTKHLGRKQVIVRTVARYLAEP